MRAALLIAGKDVRGRIRDRTALIVALVAPFGLAAILGTVIPSGDGSLDLRYAIADLDGSEVSSAFRFGPLEGIVDAGVAEIVDASDADAARDAVDDGDVDAAFVIPAGFGEAVGGADGAELQLIIRADASIAGQIGRAVIDGFVAELDAIRLSVAAALAAGDGPPSASEIEQLVAQAAEAAAEGSPIVVEQASAEVAQLDSRTYYAASMAIFFLFFTAQYGPLSLLTERHQGTLARLLAAPIHPWAVVLGKSLGSFLLGIVATAVLALASTFVLGASWGDAFGVALLILGAVTAATGITALVTTMARTEAQADGLNSIVAVSLAVLGGTFIPLSQAPELLGRLSFLTPHAWFLDGLNQLSVPSAGVGAVLLPVGVMVAIGAATGAIGLIRSRRLVVAR
jgi:ABC-2 type transport system permease protein